MPLSSGYGCEISEIIARQSHRGLTAFCVTADRDMFMVLPEYVAKGKGSKTICGLFYLFIYLLQHIVFKCDKFRSDRVHEPTELKLGLYKSGRP